MRRFDDDDEDDDEDDNDVGWWEVPREQRAALDAAEPLSQWQEDKLLLAYAQGRRRVKVGLARLPWY